MSTSPTLLALFAGVVAAVLAFLGYLAMAALLGDPDVAVGIVISVGIGASAGWATYRGNREPRG